MAATVLVAVEGVPALVAVAPVALVAVAPFVAFSLRNRQTACTDLSFTYLGQRSRSHRNTFGTYFDKQV